MKTKLYSISMFLFLLMMGSAVFSQKNLLFLGDGTETVPTRSEDSALIAYLTDEGYTITFRDDGYFNTNWTDVDSFLNYDVIFMNEVVGSGNTINYKTTGFPIPGVVTEGFVPRDDRWGMTATHDSTTWHQLQNWNDHDGADIFVVKDNTHYITKHYNVDDEITWTTQPDLNTLGVTAFDLYEVEGAVPLMNIKADLFGEMELSSFWVIPEGSSYSSYLGSDEGATISIPYKMVIMGVIGTGMGVYSADDLNFLIKRSLEWVTDDLSAVEDFNDGKEYDLSIIPNPTSGIVNLSFALSTSGKVQIDIYDITGKLIESIEPGHFDAGRNTFTLDFTDKPNAPYIISLITDNNVLTRKILKTNALCY